MGSLTPTGVSREIFSNTLRAKEVSIMLSYTISLSENRISVGGRRRDGTEGNKKC